jgi:hypothetical protein
MTRNQLYGIILIVIGLFDLIALPTIMDKSWKKVKKPPPWTGSLELVLRITGVIFLFFGISYYFFGQLE